MAEVGQTDAFVDEGDVVHFASDGIGFVDELNVTLHVQKIQHLLGESPGAELEVAPNQFIQLKR